MGKRDRSLGAMAGNGPALQIAPQSGPEAVTHR